MKGGGFLVEGRVKWFNEKKGYGFIETETHGDVFVHFSNIESNGFRTLKELEKVTLEVESSPKGPQAVKVKRLEDWPKDWRSIYNFLGRAEKNSPAFFFRILIPISLLRWENDFCSFFLQFEKKIKQQVVMQIIC